MGLPDLSCVLVWVFELREDRREDFKTLCEQFCARVDEEPKCISHRFSYNGEQVHYHVAAKDAFGVLAHVVDMGDVLGEALETVALQRLEIHGPRDQLDELRDPLAAFDPDFYTADFCKPECCHAP